MKHLRVFYRLHIYTACVSLNSNEWCVAWRGALPVSVDFFVTFVCTSETHTYRRVASKWIHRSVLGLASSRSQTKGKLRVHFGNSAHFSAMPTIESNKRADAWHTRQKIYAKQFGGDRPQNGSCLQQPQKCYTAIINANVVESNGISLSQRASCGAIGERKYIYQLY